MSEQRAQNSKALVEKSLASRRQRSLRECTANAKSPEDLSDVRYPRLIRMIGPLLAQTKEDNPITAWKTRSHSVCLAADLTGNRSPVERPIALKRWIQPRRYRLDRVK